MTTASSLPKGIHHHNRDLAMQKYLLLQEQHESVRQQLDALQPLDDQAVPRVSATTSNTPSVSPTRATSISYSPPSSQGSPPSPHVVSIHSSRHRRSSLPVGPGVALGPPVLETVLEVMPTELEMEEAKLFDVNEGIKRALTELLNCEAVRRDRALRTWVQCRLMDTEKELRSGRRRRSNS